MDFRILRLGYFILHLCQQSSSVNSLVISSVIPYPYPDHYSAPYSHPYLYSFPPFLNIQVAISKSLLPPISLTFLSITHPPSSSPFSGHSYLITNFQTTSSQTITLNAITESTNLKSVYGQSGLPTHV